VKNVLVQWPSFKLHFAASRLEAIKINCAFDFDELEANELLAAVGDRCLFPV